MSTAHAVAARGLRPSELSRPQLALRQVWGLVVYTLRESLHRWTLVTYLLGISFFLLLLATSVNLDIVEGTLASARLFGQELEVGDMGIRITDVVRGFQVAVISTLYIVGIALALFVVGNHVPSIARQGWVDLLIAQPVSRSVLLLGRALGSITVVAVGIAYLIVGSWIVLSWKTGFGNVGFLLAGLIILLTFAFCFSATVFAGIVTRNGPVSGMLGLFVWIAGHVMHAFHAFPEWRVAISAGWARQLATAISEGLYWLLPKNQGLWQISVAAARGEPVSLMPIVYSIPFAFLCLFLACWWFTKRDY